MSYPRIPNNERDPVRFFRRAAEAINWLIGKVEDPYIGQVRYEAGVLEHYDGSAWQPVP
jgi:hypothetical protein